MPHIRIKNEYLRTPEYLQFATSKESAVLQFLIAHIVRQGESGKEPAGAVKMKKNYFDKGMLCAAYSLDDIARYFGWGTKETPNKSYVSKLITRLENHGLLIKHTENTALGLKNVYQLGYCKGTYGSDDYEEHLYFDLIFDKAVRKHKQKKMATGKKQRETDTRQSARKKLERYKAKESAEQKPQLNKHGEPYFDISTPEGEKAQERWIVNELFGGNPSNFKHLAEGRKG